jgi:hypothetical protein
MIHRMSYPGIAARFFVAVLVCSFFGLCGAQDIPTSTESQIKQAQTQPEKIVPGPQNIKERTAVYVFLGWLWVSIAVLVYFLRLKIKEIDRVYNLRFFPAAEQPDESSGQPPC